MILLETANIEKFMPTVYQAEILVKNNLKLSLGNKKSPEAFQSGAFPGMDLCIGITRLQACFPALLRSFGGTSPAVS